MKKILSLLVFISFAAVSQGQITWDNAVADTARGFENTLDIETHNVVTFASAGTYRWIRTYNESCSVKTAICDKNSCYMETTDSADFTVAANESFDMICHFYPYNKCCPEGAMVSLYVFKIDEPAVNSTATYFLDLWCASLSTTDTKKDKFTIAPNPAQNQINLFDIPNSIKTIQVINIVGETVISLTEATSTIDVSALKTGIYWVAIETEGATLTKRFVKK